MTWVASMEENGINFDILTGGKYKSVRNNLLMLNVKLFSFFYSPPRSKLLGANKIKWSCVPNISTSQNTLP